MNEQLRDLSSRGRNAPLVFVDVRSFPGAFRIRGEYAIVNGQLHLSANIFKQLQKHASFSVEGSVTEPQQFAAKIVDELRSRLTEN